MRFIVYVGSETLPNLEFPNGYQPIPYYEHVVQWMRWRDGDPL